MKSDRSTGAASPSWRLTGARRAIRQEWQIFASSPPGQRFQDRYRNLHGASSRGRSIRSVCRVAGGVLVALIGLLLVLGPGPGWATVLFGLTLLAGEWLPLARLLDGGEMAARRGWSRARASWRETPLPLKVAIGAVLFALLGTLVYGTLLLGIRLLKPGSFRIGSPESRLSPRQAAAFCGLLPHLYLDLFILSPGAYSAAYSARSLSGAGGTERHRAGHLTVLVTLAGPLGCATTANLVLGLPVHTAIAQAMKEEAADLLILGARGHHFLERAAPGSVSFHQMVAEPHSVLMLRPRPPGV